MQTQPPKVITLSKEELAIAARLRADRACELIERAQNDLDTACAELSGLVGGVTVWKATSQMGDRVKALWSKVNGFRNGERYKLDDTHVQYLKRRIEEANRTAENMGT